MCLSVVSTRIVTATWNRGRKVQPYLSGNSLFSSTQCMKLNLVTGGQRKDCLWSHSSNTSDPGNWTLTFSGIFQIWKHYYDQTKNQLIPLNKGITFPLSYYRMLAREIYHLLERYPTLKHALPCYKSTHSLSEKCDNCSSFDRYKPNTDKVFPIQSLANINWLLSVPDKFWILRKPYSNNFYLFMSSFLWSSVLLFGVVFNKLLKWKTVCVVETWYVNI